MSFRKTVLIFPGLLLFVLSFAQQSKQPVLVTDLLEIKTAGSVTLSTDGKKAAYTVTSIITDEKNAGEYRYQTQIWMAHLSGAMPQMQFTTAAEGAAQPAWSPNGRKLAFVRSVEGTPQLFIAPVEGGEPRQLTRMPFGASNPVWSPDGRLIAFSSSIPLRAYANDSVLNPAGTLPGFAMEKPAMENSFLRNARIKPDPNGSLAEVRAYLYKNEQDKKAKVIHKLNFQQEAVTSPDMTVTHIFTIQPEPGSMPKAITTGFTTWSNPQFIAGTAFITAESALFPAQHPDRSLERAIYRMDTTGKGAVKLLGDSGFVYGNASVSASGKWMAYTRGKTSFVTVPDLYIAPVDKPGSAVKINYDRNKSNMLWSEDDRFVYFTAQANGGVLLLRYDTKTSQLATLSAPDEGIGSFDLRGSTMVFAKNSVTNPSELFAADAEGKQAKQISSLNSWVKDRHIVQPEKYTFKNELGLEVEYWVMKPAGFESGKKYPLLLEIHGGPTAMWGPGESSMWHEFQYFCSKGYGVVYSNPRGSGGYGEAFMRANINDWGNGPMRDVLTALDKTMQQGWADPKKLLVTGGSYAGYLVSYILGHDTRFAAACAQRGVYDLRTFFGEGNAWRLVPNYFGGYPWEKKTYDVLERESPITYVQNIRTPLIIFHGEQDLRTGVIQSEQLYKSLKVLGREVEYVRHPGATHEITRSGNNRQRIDQMLRTWEFFERYIRD